ncbi:hypothetical protein GLAREA_03706 [Glarea lozoyensis ATCC 20868]|uniref:SprT-like domain-containing protein n=1 Tax=Glarea lozoyensis (strain ATCC 20868 / MF5171) TaxID=1116229 RepID=S3D0R0_GLAL2|nr:uncharacterized protein GLAREA_03706 [Glarea lozoyensis ATCC 20868]EPE30739.1 hypothetical protein GLAREA_03706 [Glarea lozoyensis ATCC 20868]
MPQELDPEEWPALPSTSIKPAQNKNRLRGAKSKAKINTKDTVKSPTQFPTRVRRPRELRKCFKRDTQTSSGSGHKLSYKEEDLLQKMRAHLASPYDSHRQEWFRKQLHDLVQQSSKTPTDWEAILLRYRDMFNKIIFKGLLNRQLCPLTFFKLGTHKSKLFGWSLNLRDIPDITPETITGKIDIFEIKDRGRSLAEQLRIYLGVLLHEMVHAFQCLYTCGCIACEIPDDLFKEAGNGYELFFYGLSGAIEIFMRDVLEVKVSLYRYDQLQIAIGKGELGVDDLPKVDWKAYDLDVRHIGKLIDGVQGRWETTWQNCG